MKKRTKRTSLINRLDKVFGEVVRRRGACERCGNTETLQTSHIYSRTYQNIRWDLKNAHCLCAKCHFWWHKNPLESFSFVEITHSPEDINYLKLQRNIPAHFSDDELEGMYKKLKEML